MDYRQVPAWRKAMRLAELACGEVAAMRANERFIVGSQIARAAISVPSNIAEGWARDSIREKARFLGIAHGSLDELNTQILLCANLGWIPRPRAQPIFELYEDTGRMLTALRRHFRSAPK